MNARDSSLIGEPFGADETAASDTRDAFDRYLVRNVLALADDHRAHCPGESCDVSLMPLAKLCQRAGITLTDTEMERLW